MKGDQEARATFLSGLLSLIALSGAVFFMFVICGGVALYGLGVVAGLTVLGYAHYLLWGRGLSEEVAGEREDEEARRVLEEQDDDWSRDDPFRRHPRI